MLNREQKGQVLAELVEKLTQSKTTIFTNYSGLKVKSMQSLRKMLKEKAIDMKVAKNNLLKIALEKSNIKIEGDIYKQQLATAFASEDEVEPCRIITTFIKENPSLRIVGGILNKVFISADEIKKLAFLPGREELYAKVAGSCAAPLVGIVNVLAGNLRGLVNVLKQYSEKKQ